VTEKLERFISQNRKYCWESEFEQGEYCIGENDVKEFFVAITGQGANSGSRTGSPDGSLSGERDVKNLGGECKWTPTHDDYNTFDTDCGQSFCLDADSPKDNNMKFCCYCSKSLVEG